jgi:hypothetical protein
MHFFRSGLFSGAKGTVWGGYLKLIVRHYPGFCEYFEDGQRFNEIAG